MKRQDDIISSAHENVAFMFEVKGLLEVLLKTLVKKKKKKSKIDPIAVYLLRS